MTVRLLCAGVRTSLGDEGSFVGSEVHLGPSSEGQTWFRGQREVLQLVSQLRCHQAGFA